MTEHIFDTITRRAAAVPLPSLPLPGGGVSRRASLLTLGLAGLAAVLAKPVTVEAKNNNNNDKCKKDKKQCNQDLEACNALCPAQATDCTNFVSAICGTNPDCQFLYTCCTFLGSCDATGFMACLNNPPQPPPR